MNYPRFAGLVARAFLLLASLVPSPAFAQTVPGGTIEGRVFNTRNGEYLEKARLTIDGTALEAFTDSSGQYRFTDVPAGTAKVRVFFTGLDVQAESVVVAAGGTAQQNFSLAATQRSSVKDKDTGVVKLSEFVVGASKEMDGAAIAINEQRFASNIVNVVSADEFGQIAEGNVGEFLKFIPGISMDYGGGDARTISKGGVPSNNVPVTIGGFALSSAASSGTGRTVELEQVSINNIARIEVYHSPTPESPGSALAGGVNMVPRGAFERSRPVFNSNVYFMFRDAEKSLEKTPGPIRDKTYKIHPGLDFSYVVPVNKRFGFTLSGGHSSQYTMQDFMQNTWRGAGNATTVVATATNGLPDTTPDKPYLTNYAVRDGTKLTNRDSVGATIDFKLARNDMVSFSFQYAYFGAEFNNRTLTFNISRVLPGNFDSYTTNGDVGQGSISVSNGSRQKTGTTYMPTVIWRHNGPIWKADAGASFSHSSNHYRDIDKGYFNGANTSRANVTVAFSDIFYLRPRGITVRDGTTRAPVDPYSLSSYVLTSATSDTLESSDVQRGAKANLARDFRVRGVPVAVKIGTEIRESIRDIRGTNPTYTFVGADHVAANTSAVQNSDDNAGIVLDEIFSQRNGPWGFPKIQYVSNYKYWELYQAHPDYFTTNQDTAYRNAVSRSKYASEVLSSAYLRTDTALFGGRLKLVGGVRAEQTNVIAQGFLSDPTGNYLRDASGKVVPQRDAAGNILFTGTGATRAIVPVLIEPTTIPNPAGGAALSNALAISKLTLLDRGQHTNKEYLRFFPSLNASFNLTQNLIARASVYRSVGRPDFGQYAGGLTLPDVDLPANPNSNRISVNNAGIKAWSANSSKVRLEYYFERVGQISIGAFRRDFRNLFGSTVFQATPEFLALYDLDPDTYGPFYVATNFNVPGLVRMEGTEFDYKQALTFLPQWARGVQVFANMSAQRATGDSTASFSNYQPRTYNWGISLSRPKYTMRLNWNYRGRRRGSLIAASVRSIEPGTYNWQSKRLYIDLSGDYSLTKRIGLFASMRNLNDATEDTERRGPNTPAHAQLLSREDFGSLWTIGIKGTF